MKRAIVIKNFQSMRRVKEEDRFRKSESSLCHQLRRTALHVDETSLRTLHHPKTFGSRYEDSNSRRYLLVIVGVMESFELMMTMERINCSILLCSCIAEIISAFLLFSHYFTA